MSMIRNTDYLQRLTNQKKKIFQSSELALLWGMTNKHTLQMTMYRYQKKGSLFRIAHGLYSVVPVDALNPFEIGCAVSGPLSYVSCESVLFQEGFINQAVRKITLLGKKRKEFTVGKYSFSCRYLNPKFLVNREGISHHEGYSMANPLRALADLLWINPGYFVDGMDRINKRELLRMQKQLRYI